MLHGFCFKLKLAVDPNSEFLNNFTTTTIAIPLATAHLALGGFADSFSPGELTGCARGTSESMCKQTVHYLQSLLMFPSDAVEKPICAWLLARNQLRAGATQEELELCTAMAHEAEKWYAEGGLSGANLEMVTIPARDEVTAALTKLESATSLQPQRLGVALLTRIHSLAFERWGFH
jgi:hypothetical protein